MSPIRPELRKRKDAEGSPPGPEHTPDPKATTPAETSSSPGDTSPSPTPTETSPASTPDEGSVSVDTEPNDTLEKAIAHVRATNETTKKSIQDALNVSSEEADRLLAQMEARGVIGPAIPFKSREILPESAPSTADAGPVADPDAGPVADPDAGPVADPDAGPVADPD
ncbi:hypothetical protein HQ487_00520, partial [Candidatus Uhrbacteria bacterium]|nr:hypothetical protein [Candidatus Uhrbacteria bacterium]